MLLVGEVEGRALLDMDRRLRKDMRRSPEPPPAELGRPEESGLVESLVCPPVPELTGAGRPSGVLVVVVGPA